MVKVEQIYDIEMPKSCKDCNMLYIGFVTLDYKCCFTKKDVSWDVKDGTKPDWCPLTEVESKVDWYDIPSDEMTLVQARQAVKELRKFLVERRND